MADGAPAPAAPVGAPAPAGGTEPKAPGAPPVVAPVVEADPYEELLKNKPISIKNKTGKSVEIKDRKSLEHYLNKGFGSHEAHERANKLEADLKHRDGILAKIEAGDDVSVSMLREALGPKWKQIVQREALNDFDEEERMKGIPPELRQKLEEARQLKAEKATRDQQDQQRQSEQSKRQQDQELREMQQEVARIGIPALKAAGFPSSPPAATLNRLAAYMAENIDLARDNGRAELPIEVIADVLREDMQAEYKVIAHKFIESKDFDGAVKWLGEDFVNFVRRGDLARLRGGANVPPAAPKDAPPPAEKKKDFWSF